MIKCVIKNKLYMGWDIHTSHYNVWAQRFVLSSMTSLEFKNNLVFINVAFPILYDLNCGLSLSMRKDLTFYLKILMRLSKLISYHQIQKKYKFFTHPDHMAYNVCTCVWNFQWFISQFFYFTNSGVNSMQEFNFIISHIIIF